MNLRDRLSLRCVHPCQPRHLDVRWPVCASALQLCELLFVIIQIDSGIVGARSKGG